MQNKILSNLGEGSIQTQIKSINSILSAQLSCKLDLTQSDVTKVAAQPMASRFASSLFNKVTKEIEKKEEEQNPFVTMEVMQAFIEQTFKKEMAKVDVALSFLDKV
jgi:F420-dependent methylenetetrahydromethanopterin dehydrogenase